MRIDYYLDGLAVNPINRHEIYLEINHDQQAIINRPVPHVGINNLFFALSDIKKIMAKLNQPPGITEGIPFDIVVIENGAAQTINMFIDPMNGFQRSNDKIQASVKMLQSIDRLNDAVDAFTYESLYNETGVTPFLVDNISYSSYKQFLDQRCVYVPYVISTIPNTRDAFLALFACIFVATQLKQVVTDIENLVGSYATATFWGYVALILETIALAAWVIILVASLINLITSLINSLIQPLKYHAGMLVVDLLKITAVKLGLNFHSSIWEIAPYNQLVYIPEKYSPLTTEDPTVLDMLGFGFQNPSIRGYTSPAPGIQHGYFNGTGGEFLRVAKTLCNGKFIIPDGTNDLVLERRDYYPPSTPYQLPDLRQDWNGYNTDELMSSIVLKFVADLNERNCIDHKFPNGNYFYPGTVLQATTEQVTTVNKQMACLKGLREINFPVARGVNKDSYTYIEKVVKGLSVFLNNSIDYINILAQTLAISYNGALYAYNGFVILWNILISIIEGIAYTFNIIIAAVNLIPGVNISLVTAQDFHGLIAVFPFASNTINPFANFISPHTFDIKERLNALLLEDDIMNVPKIVQVDTSRSEYQSANHIGYLHNDNPIIVNAKNLWEKFYFIDSFVADPHSYNPLGLHNRFTKISPAKNDPSEVNKFALALSGFKSLVNNPKFLDNYGEDVFADSIKWWLEQNGAAEFLFRKPKWLRNPQHPNALERAKEIEVNNLRLKISIPNGQ